MVKETYVRLEPAATRLGNWMFQYAAAKTAAPDAEVVFVVPEAQMKYASAVEKYRGLFGGARIESLGRIESLERRSLRDTLNFAKSDVPPPAGIPATAQSAFREFTSPRYDAERDRLLLPSDCAAGGAKAKESVAIPRMPQASAVDSRIRVGLYQDAKWVDRELCRRLFLGPLTEHFEGGGGHAGRVTLPGTVSIHVRRGDYMALPHRHPFVGKKYLREAVSRFPGAEFLVFSDDIAWCKRFFRSLEPPTRQPANPRFRFAEGNDVLTDLYLMTQCRGGHICSNSTFSWWGAYLGDEKARTVFPSMWYGPSVRDTDWKGLYFAGSEIVENGYTPGLWMKAWAMRGKECAGRVLRRFGRLEVWNGGV